MKKIAIMTFSRANSYGAVLQAYALRNKIIDLGHTCDIINYLCEEIEKPYKILPRYKNNAPKKFILDFFRIYPKFIRKNNFSSFRINYLNNNIKINKSELHNLNGIYDLFLSGSDQVFNTDLTNGDTSYFLDFVEESKKKIAYAPSFGKETLTEEETKLFRYLLKQFKYLSAREKQGQSIMYDLLGVKVPLVLDPTLLINEHEWKKIMTIPKDNNYILLYVIFHSKKTILFAEKLSKLTGCKIIFITSTLKREIKAKYVSCTPSEWLGYFFNAKYIVTNSFHGICFSINFNKNCFVDLTPKIQLNSRLENLMDLFNLRNRLIDNIGEDYNQQIDFKSVNEILESEREASVNYLKTITK